MLDGSRDPDTVLIPWQGWSLSSADFVLTRTMEVLVHSDDLAASIGVEHARLPVEVAQCRARPPRVVAVDRHGQAAVLARSAGRSARTGPVSAF